MMKFRQKGSSLVEFVMVAGVFFLLLFGIIEVGRLFFTMNTLNELVRRGARIAIVTDPSKVADIQASAIFASADGNSTVLSNLSTGDVTVAYLDDTGSPLSGTPAITDIGYVQVSIESYTHTLLIPFVYQDLSLPRFVTVLPRESLGQKQT